jgi:hypothetical protein
MTRSQPQIPTDRVETVIGRFHTVWTQAEARAVEKKAKKARAGGRW